MECGRYNKRRKGVKEICWVYARVRAQNGFVLAGREERCLDYEWPESLGSTSIRHGSWKQANVTMNAKAASSAMRHML